MTSENGTNMYMPVAPAYGYGYGGGNGGGLFGGDWWGIILVILLLGGGMWGGFGGMGGFGGYGNMMLGYDFPWLLTGQQGINANTNAGFNQAATAAALGDIQGALTTGFGNVQTSLCSGFAGVNATVNGAQNAIAQQLNANEIASLNRSFAEQTANTQGFNAVQGQLAQCCCDNKSAALENRYVLAQEGCNTRYASAQNTRDIIDSQNRGTQAILDKLCQLELDGVKRQVADEQRENANLRSDLQYARNQADRAAQNAFIAQGFSNEVDALYNRLNSCPVPTTPVFGRTPIFTCNGNGNGFGCGCGCAA